MLYDREREDGVFSPKDPTAPASSLAPSDGSFGSGSSREWNPLDSMFVTMPPWHPVVIASTLSNGGKNDKEKDKDKIPKNPVSHWRVSKKKIVGSSRSITHRTDCASNFLALIRLCILSGCEICSGYRRRWMYKNHRRSRRTVRICTIVLEPL